MSEERSFSKGIVVLSGIAFIVVILLGGYLAIANYYSGEYLDVVTFIGCIIVMILALRKLIVNHRNEIRKL